MASLATGVERVVKQEAEVKLEGTAQEHFLLQKRWLIILNRLDTSCV